MKTKVVPIVLGALGTVPLQMKGKLKGIGVDTSITLIQKSALLGSTRILKYTKLNKLETNQKITLALAIFIEHG